MLSHVIYPLFSAELESAEALASSQQKFQTLDLADYKVMRQLLYNLYLRSETRRHCRC